VRLAMHRVVAAGHRADANPAVRQTTPTEGAAVSIAWRIDLLAVSSVTTAVVLTGGPGTRTRE